MLALSLTAAGGQVERVLAIGSHADDIEIGCGATLLALTRKRPLHVTWVVIAASGARADEARQSADAFLTDAANADVQDFIRWLPTEAEATRGAGFGVVAR
jgi:LmbE family N-acetylglucosaminyl deacetylase